MGQKSNATGLRVNSSISWRNSSYSRLCLKDTTRLQYIEHTLNTFGIISGEIRLLIFNEKVCLYIPVLIYKQNKHININKAFSLIKNMLTYPVTLYIIKTKCFYYDAKIFLGYINTIDTRRLNKRTLQRLSLNIPDIKVQIRGRLRGAQMASTLSFHKGQLMLSTVSQKVSYACLDKHTKYGTFGMKCWIKK
jgi:small subunit ribosomal protein S3